MSLPTLLEAAFAPGHFWVSLTPQHTPATCGPRRSLPQNPRLHGQGPSDVTELGLTIASDLLMFIGDE